MVYTGCNKNEFQKILKLTLVKPTQNENICKKTKTSDHLILNVFDFK